MTHIKAQTDALVMGLNAFPGVFARWIKITRAMIVNRHLDIVFLDELVHERKGVLGWTAAQHFESGGMHILEGFARGGLVVRQINHARARHGDASVSEFLNDGLAFARRAGGPINVVFVE